MAIIGKIRDNGWLVLIVIGVALMAFIMGDWSKITGGDEPVYGIGTIYGEKVDDKKFTEALDIARTNAIQQAQQQGQQPQEVDETRVWKSLVEEQLLEKEYEALGIDVSDDEFDAYLYAARGFEPQAEFLNSPVFTDSITKAFSPKKLEARVNEMREDPEQAEAWKNTEEYYKKKRRQEKYFDILGQGIYITNLEAKNDFLANNEKKSISYVVKRFRDLLDADYEKSATDKKLKAYYEDHKNDKKYQVKDNSRRLHLFEINIEPSEKDTKRFLSELDSLKKLFAVTKNDSAFVTNKKNSELSFYTSGPYSTAIPKSHRKAQEGKYITYPDGMDETYRNAAIGDVIGPYEFNGSQSIGKVIGFTSDTINARHILISADPQKGDDMVAKEALADSILKAVNNDNFESYVSKYSGDTGSAEKGGDLGDFYFGDMVPQFATYVANEPIGKIGKVQTQFGFHIIQVTARKGKQYPRLAVVQKTLKASKETIKSIEEEAYSMLYKLDEKLSAISDPYKRVARFDTIASRADYFSKTLELKDNAPAFSNFNTRYAEDKLLDLAFKEESEVGTLVNSPIKDKDRYIIAIFAAKIEKGTPKFEDIKDRLKADYIKEQKVNKFTSEMKGKKLTDIKGKGITVNTAEVTMANTQLTGAGFEPKVVGAVFAILKDGQKSLPIEGTTGVFVVKVEKTFKAVAAKDYDAEKAKLANAVKSQLQNTTRRALTELGDVVDNRRLFNTGVRR